MIPNFEESEAARYYAEEKANLERRLNAMEAELKSYRQTNPDIRRSLTETLSRL